MDLHVYTLLDYSDRVSTIVGNILASITVGHVAMCTVKAKLLF